MKLAWTYKEWCSRWPSLGSDELWRHTLVLPFPRATGRSELDGEPLYWAWCVVVRPWWMCRHAIKPAQRRYIRWERGLSLALEGLGECVSDDDFNQAYNGYLAHAGTQPPFAP